MVPDVLLTMRLSDMRRRHPRQDNSRHCSGCGEQVGIYPSGQLLLAENPGLRILCNHCIDPRPGDAHLISPAVLEEIKESYDARKDAGESGEVT